MKEFDYKRLAYSKGTPSAFIIEAPFQLMCAMEAIKEFEIVDYFIMLVLERNSPRNIQLFQMLSKFNIEYACTYTDDLDPIRFADEVPDMRQFQRVFIGDYRDKYILSLASRVAKHNSISVYLDDGAATIPLFLGITSHPPRNIAKYLRWRKEEKRQKEYLAKIKAIWKGKGLHDQNFYFTLYSNLANSKFVCYQNKFRNLCDTQSCYHDSLVLVIGTVSSAYSEAYGIDLVQYESIMWYLLSSVVNNHKGKEIIYIPHGRDDNEVTKEFCRLLNIEYKKIDSTIELHLVENSTFPAHVYGLGSTALYTIKMMAPKVSVHNWFVNKIDAQCYYDYLCVAESYKLAGIQTIEIKYPCTGLFERFKI